MTQQVTTEPKTKKTKSFQTLHQESYFNKDVNIDEPDGDDSYQGGTVQWTVSTEQRGRTEYKIWNSHTGGTVR